MQHLGTTILETSRLVLRPFLVDDAQAMYNNWASDADVTKYLMWPKHDNVEVSQNVLHDWVPRYTESDYYNWAITLKENVDIPIGSIGVIHNDDKTKMVHIGYCIGKSWWNKGITSETLSAVIHYLFKKVEVNRIESRHDTRNPNSGKVMLKCGLKQEGLMREADWNNQGICDSAIYALLRKDYYVSNLHEK